jgi:hypothetical protein
MRELQQPERLEQLPQLPERGQHSGYYVAATLALPSALDGRRALDLSTPKPKEGGRRLLQGLQSMA